jgi:GST-like protein
MACYPWIVPHASHGQDLAEFPNLQRWFAAIAARPATQRAYEGVKPSYARTRVAMTDEARALLFGQT